MDTNNISSYDEWLHNIKKESKLLMRQNTKPITLDDAANQYANELGTSELEKDFIYSCFVHGAQWQKEQLKELFKLLPKAIRDLNNCGATIIADKLLAEVNKLNS